MVTTVSSDSEIGSAAGMHVTFSRAPQRSRRSTGDLIVNGFTLDLARPSEV